MDASAESLQAQLAVQSKQIDLMLTIDRIRDEAGEEGELVTAAASSISTAIGAEVCLLCLIDPDDQQIGVRVLLDRLGTFEQAGEETLRRAVEGAIALPATQQLEIDETLRARGWQHGLAAPLRVGRERLGALLLFNQARAFGEIDDRLLKAACSQLDSALLHARTVHDLQQERHEIQTIYRIDRIRDQGLPFDEMLDAVLAELCRTIPSESGYILLFDSSGRQLELKAATDHDLLNVVDHYQIVYAAAREAIEQAKPIARSLTTGRIRSLICIPLILNEHVIGVIGVLNRHERAAFTRADRQLLWAIGSQIDTAIFERLEIQKYREVLGRKVGPQVMQRLLSTPDRDLLKGERVTATILFSDIRGFTTLSEHSAPETLMRMLNAHLSAMTEVALAYEGTIDKFVGDCVMVLFNAPERQPDHALRAVRTALDMMAAHRQLMQQWESLPPIGIGLDTGDTLVGNFGSARRNEYTAIGRHVNLASRLCGAAEGDQILISAAIYALIEDKVTAQALPALKLKGIAEAVEVYEITGLS